jgi:phosphatidylserine decarboxylase
VLFKQIAGAMARRIVYHIRVGDKVKAGERFGIVKFGSRMDVLVSRESEIYVKVGDRVTAGETILGKLPGGIPAEVTAEFHGAALS